MSRSYFIADGDPMDHYLEPIDEETRLKIDASDYKKNNGMLAWPYFRWAIWHDIVCRFATSNKRTGRIKNQISQWRHGLNETWRHVLWFCPMASQLCAEQVSTFSLRWRPKQQFWNSSPYNRGGFTNIHWYSRPAGSWCTRVDSQPQKMKSKIFIDLILKAMYNAKFTLDGGFKSST